MPTRMIRDGILLSERLNAVSPMAELHYRRLMSVTDDYGRMEAASSVVRAAAWSMREGITSEMVEEWHAELSAGDRPLIVIYEVAGKKYLQIQDFGQRIRTDRKTGQPMPSRYPDPDCAAQRGDVRRSAAQRGEAPSLAVRKPETGERITESGERRAGAATAPPPASPLSADEWGQEDPDQLAQRHASEMVRDHWFPSDRALCQGYLARELATAVNPAASATAIRKSHGLWVERVEQARQTGSLPRSLENKALQWWLKDRYFEQEPRFGEPAGGGGQRSRKLTRLEQELRDLEARQGS